MAECVFVKGVRTDATMFYASSREKARE